ncbi:hypothetical protein J6590_011357 [Homalodisca vitripennis]|nr:hypothetical protein J6590_011357 [Homalodisca vitripennis]
MSTRFLMVRFYEENYPRSSKNNWSVLREILSNVSPNYILAQRACGQTETFSSPCGRASNLNREKNVQQTLAKSPASVQFPLTSPAYVAQRKLTIVSTRSLSDTEVLGIIIFFR